MNKLKFKILLTTFLSFSLLNANSDIELNIDSLLNDIEKKTDLSEKTKLENSGISIIYTRDDINRMQARYLKDILKSNATFGYNENRYGFPDPLTTGMNIPFSSSSMRVFIDNQELTAGMSGSGLFTHGDIDIGFVDHIEIYTQSPTYEYSTEPTLMLIKLYSRSALKDTGSKVELNIGSFGDARVSGFHAVDINENWSLFSYLSVNNDKREKYTSHSTELSRDKKVMHIFTSLQTDNHKIIIDAILNGGDSFISQSIDATPLQSTTTRDSLHIGYDGVVENFSFLATYDYIHTKNNLLDDVTPSPFFAGRHPVTSMDVKAKSEVLTTEIKYKYNTSKNNLISGLKYRYKKYGYSKLEVNNKLAPKRNNDTQAVSTLFVQDEYSLQNNLILTAGAQYVNVYNKDALYNEKDNLLLYRFALTYLRDNLTFKTIASHNESYLEPYLIDSNFIAKKEIKNVVSNLIYEDIIYTKDDNRYEFVLGFMRTKNYLLPVNNFQLDNYDENIDLYTALFRWEYAYNKYDKLFSEFSYQHLKNIPDVDTYKIYKVVLRSLNTYGKFDIFNEIIYDRDNIMEKNFFDYSAGVKYKYTEDLTLSLKAENIFNKAKETSYIRMNPITFQQESPLEISPIDRKVVVSMEYLF